MRVRRRELLKMGLFGSAALMLPIERVARTQLAVNDRIPTSRLPAPFTTDFVIPPRAVPVTTAGAADVYSLVQTPGKVEILPGLQTEIWGYNGITPGPTIVAEAGRPTIVRQSNNLPPLHPTLRYKPWTSTHLHGHASKPQYDGYASDVTNPGEFKDYVYENDEEARTAWYHDHGVHFTAPNAYMGLAAMYIIHDDLERSLQIPVDSPYDVPLVIKDAIFASSGDLIFDDQGESSLYGDVILVNGKPWPRMPVEKRKYRFRILNASISRSYDLALDSGEPITVIASEGGLYPAPQRVTSFRHGMAERYEVIIDFSNHAIGDQVVLRNLGLPNNVDFDNTDVIMRFDVVSKAKDMTGNEIPDQLNPNHPAMQLVESPATPTRQLDFKRHNGGWAVNGLTWDDVINSGFKDVVAHPGAGDVEVWELRNNSGGWFHPVHIHLVDFRVLDRDGQPPHPWELGPKDTVYVGESESVRVIARFATHTGRYMIHCHNLVHEDHDMMVQYEVGEGGDDPITAAAAALQPGGPL